MSETHITTRQANRFFELDALRGVAALSVLAFHYSLHIRDAYPVLRFGNLGVDLFFIISGFVIMLSLSKVKHGYEFVVSRVSRLFPTYWTAVTLLIIGYFTYNSYHYGFPADVYWKQYFANMTMLQFYLGFEHLDGPYWTLTIELLFYAFVLVLFQMRILKAIVPVSFGLILFGLVLTYKYWAQPFAVDYIVKFPLSQYLPLFLAGILFLKLYFQERKSWLTVIQILACYGGAVIMVKFTGRVPAHVSLTEYAIVIGCFFTAFFLFVFGKLKFIVNRGTVFLGQISYALYLIHQFLSTYILIPELMKLGVNYYVAAFGISMPVCILLAAFITYKIERPGGRWLKKHLLNLFERRLMPLYNKIRG